MGRLTTLLSYWTPPRFSAAASPLITDAVTALRATSLPAADDQADQLERSPRGPHGAGGEDGSVGAQLHLVVQLFADLGADAEGRRRRSVPYPAEPATLADQLTVMSTDLLAVGANADSAAQLGHLTERLDALRAVL